MLAPIATSWALGVIALWPRAWGWDGYRGRPRFSGWNMAFILLWPVSGVLLGCGVAWDAALAVIAPAPVIRGRWGPEAPVRDHGGRRLSWL